MDPAVRQALKDNGMDRLDTSAFPDLNTWREEVRQYGFAVSAAPTPYDRLVTVKDQLIASCDGSTIRLRIYRTSGIKTGSPALYWMHGGGLMGGTPEQDDAQMKQIAAETGATVISVDYRLAPEFPYPVPIDDCFDGLLWVSDNAAALGIDSCRIAVGGASAGGGLAAALTLMVKQRGGPKLIHQSLTYPMRPVFGTGLTIYTDGPPTWVKKEHRTTSRLLLPLPVKGIFRACLLPLSLLARLTFSGMKTSNMPFT
jgi:acetyl esterase/lipase